METSIEFRENINPTREFRSRVLELAARENIHSICDIGGGRNPILDIVQAADFAVDYTLLDVSSEELALAPQGYKTLLADAAGSCVPAVNAFDLVFSRMVAEHVRSGERLHRNIFEMLRPGGIALHFFPTLFALPFVVNRLLPEAAASGLMDMVRPRDRAKQGKFPAYYDWCRGPVPHQLKRFRQVGFEIVRFVGYFGHGYYQNIPILKRLHPHLVRFLVEHPFPSITSFAIVELRKPL